MAENSSPKLKKEDNLKEQLKDLKTSLAILGEALEQSNQGFVIVDKEGRIVEWHYEKLFGIKKKDVIGKPVEDVIENTRMHIVVKTGKKEIFDVQNIQGKDMITSRIPIKKNNEVVGAVGTVLFKDAQEVRSLAQKLELLENTFKKYKHEIKRIQQAKYSFDNIITQNKYMEYLKDMAKRAAESKSTILIRGESGTGKEFFAHAIHKASHRRYGAFITINCGAIPSELLESELFGYEEGAFTGAKKKGKIGKFEMANGGTILLDEIGEMPIDMQVKILRVLEERELERIGGNKKIPLDIRVIAATNEDIEGAIRKGSFRQDLYYRLNVIRFYIPPLRERRDDIPLLIDGLMKELTKKMDIESKEFTKEAIAALKEYAWPGNVRELRNVIESLLNTTISNTIYLHDLPSYLLGNLGREKNEMKKPKLLKEIVAEAEIQAIRDAIKQSDGNRTKAAKLLGIHRTALYKKIEMYNMDINKL